MGTHSYIRQCTIDTLDIELCCSVYLTSVVNVDIYKMMF